MDKDTNELKLLKLRSIGACIRDGYRLYIGNFRKIFRATWLAAVAYAVVSGLLMNIQTTMLHAAPYCNMGITLLTVLLATFGFSLLYQHQTTDAISRPAKWYGYLDKRVALRSLMASICLMVVMVAYALLCLVACLQLAYYLSPIAVTLALSVLALIPMLTVPPMLIPLYRFSLRADQQSSARKGISMRYWGASIMIVIVVVIVTYALTLVTELPAVVLIFANVVSQKGALQGDPTGMPDYMTWVNGIVFTLAGFIQAYVILSSLFPLYYLYGSSEQHENERKQAESETLGLS